MRAKLVLAAFMAVATAATGLFIHVRLSQKPRAPVLAEAVAIEAAEAAPAATETPAPPAETPTASNDNGLVVPIKPTVVRTVAIPSPTQGDVDGDGLGHDDPRWGRAANGDKGAREAPSAKSTALAFADPNSDPAEDGAEASDENQTAAIPPVAIVPATRPEPKAKPAPKPEVDADALPGVTSGKSAGKSVQIARAVNMRSSPRSGSKVIRVLPRGANVGLVSCSGWCEVTYEGSRGYIYRSFLSGGGGNVRKTRNTNTNKTAQESPKKPNTLMDLLAR